MAKKKEEKPSTWIIGMSGSDADDVITYRVVGTKKQVKKHLINCIKDDRDEDRDNFEYGTTAMKDLETRYDGSIYGYTCFSDHHNDFTATPEVPVKYLDDKGHIMDLKRKLS